MAEKPLTTTRRTLLGAAASLPIAALAHSAVIASEAKQSSSDSGAALDCRASLATTWTRRLARYRRLADRMKAETETGFLWKANRRYDRDRAVIKARFGSWEAALGTPEGRELGRAAFDRVARAEEAYYDRCTAPAMRAAVLVCQTPVPDLPALLSKIEVMQAHELQEEGSMPTPALELLVEDVERLVRERPRA
ncbi:MAG TPA: hypothetical protein VHM92_06485 [Allosphingosinicella sp.]|nr:hypothetical protein [Allosphingosinicella sp.]